MGSGKSDEIKSEVIGSLDAGTGGAQLEVVLCEREGESTIALQLSTWHEGIGWQRQKTIPFTADKIGQLQRLLSQTRNQMEERKRTVGAAAQVIEFAYRGSGSQAVPHATQSATQSDEVKSALN
jgi:hypothetical protein